MFLQNKYTRWYFSIIEKAKNQNRKKTKIEYYESHHIIPKCLNGTEVVLLTAKEHFICHLLLCRMVEGSNKYKMINALIKMAYSKSNGQQRHTSMSFSLIRKLIAEKNTALFKGRPKSETVRNNMKGKSGKWKRTEKHNRQASERQKGKPLAWLQLPDDSTEKIKIRNKISIRMKKHNPMKDDNAKHKMINSLKRKRWFTNGENDMFCENCPTGYKSGRTKNRKVSKKCMKEKIDQERVAGRLVLRSVGIND